MKAKDIMSTPVVSVGPDTPLREIVSLMLAQHISGLPVMADGKLLGVINENDLLRRFEIGTDRCAAEKSWWEQVVHRDKLPMDYVRSHARLARDLMVAPVVTVADEASISEVASIFAARHIRRVPVLRDGRVVGIVTRADVIRAIALKMSHDDALAPQTDAAIRSQLLGELERQHWWHSITSTCDVHEGVVHFHGLFQAEGDRQAARVAAENVPGVKSVEDHRIPASTFQPMF
jgi:CBS domain-containing protein